MPSLSDRIPNWFLLNRGPANTRTSELSIRLESGDRPDVVVSPQELSVSPGGRVKVSVVGAEQFVDQASGNGFLSVEVHMPGNKERNVMHQRGTLLVGRKDACYFDARGGFIEIGRNAKSGESHEYRVFAHFRGSVISRQSTGSPTMIVD